MKRFLIVMTVGLFTLQVPGWTAYQFLPVQSQLTLIDRGVTRREPRTQNYGFRMEIVDDSGAVKVEENRGDKPFVAARKNERYAIRLYNPLPIRVGVNLTVDGVNSISGKPSGISDGEKWIMEPYATLTISGWQVNGEEARRFFFTPKPKSYAAWRGRALRKDLKANCGVIGAAFFWSQDELDAYFAQYPVVLNPPTPTSMDRDYSSGSEAASLSSGGQGLSAPSIAAKKEMRAGARLQQAGTGMGERESHPITRVEFHYDRGMYELSQALVVYYDFVEPERTPNPFPALSYAPEM